MTCHWLGCGREDTRPYQSGASCPKHTPAKMAGRSDVPVDPALTAVALYERGGVKHGYEASAGSLIDQRAVASGRRRFKSAAEYRAAREAEEARKMERKRLGGRR
jgi:hypothetical protein